MLDTLRRTNSIMMIAAHPDDIDNNCGATVAQWTSEGTRAFAVIVTNGEKGGLRNNFDSQQLAIERQNEQRAAAGILGIEAVEFLNQADGSVSYSDALRGAIVRLIRKWKPDMVFTHDPSVLTFPWGEINHVDHRTVGQLAIDAIRPCASGRLYYPEQLASGELAVHAVRHLAFWGANEPNQWLNVGGSLPAKVAALACHQTQYPDRQAVERWVYRTAEKSGMEAAMSGPSNLAECFKYIQLSSAFE